MRVEFKPWLRPDGQYAFQIFVNDNPIGFIWFIESYDGLVMVCDRGDITCGTTYSLEECQLNCNWLNSRVEVRTKNNKQRIFVPR